MNNSTDYETMRQNCEQQAKEAYDKHGEEGLKELVNQEMHRIDNEPDEQQISYEKEEERSTADDEENQEGSEGGEEDVAADQEVTDTKEWLNELVQSIIDGNEESKSILQQVMAEGNQFINDLIMDILSMLTGDCKNCFEFIYDGSHF